MIYKKQLIHTLLDRTYKINSSNIGFDTDVKDLVKKLLRNLFPKRFIDRAIKRFLDLKHLSQQNNKGIENKTKETRYFKLPYIGNLSNHAKTKVEKILKRSCKENIDVKLVFGACKISSYFSPKDHIPKCFVSNVVYKYTCQECNSCYVGRTHKYFDTRCTEHLGSDANSSIYKHHLNNRNCRDKNDKTSFEILDYAKTELGLALKEAMHIK